MSFKNEVEKEIEKRNNYAAWMDTLLKREETKTRNKKSEE